MEKLIIIAAVAVILLVIIGRIIMRSRAAKKAKEYAETRGWKYEKSDATILDSYPQQFPFYSETGDRNKPGISFGDGTTDEAQDVLSFTVENYPGHSFTYTYTTYDRGSDNETSTQNHYWHVVGLDLPEPLPTLTIRRRRKTDAFTGRITQPVEFTHAELNAAYTIHSEHPPAAHDIVTPHMAQWLLTEELRNEIVLQDHKIYVYKKGRQKLENIDPLLKQLTSFLSHIPTEIWQKAREEYPRPHRVKHVQALDLSQMKAAYDEWREAGEGEPH